MGFQRSVLKLKFRGEEFKEFEGLEITMRRLSMGDMLSVSQLADLGNSLAEMIGPLDQLLSIMAASIIDWNLEDDRGMPVAIEKGEPAEHATPDNGMSITDGTGKAVQRYTPSSGMYALDLDLIMAIVKHWLSVATEIKPDLKKESNSTAMSAELFSLMEQASVNQAISSKPDELISSSDVMAATP